MSDAKPNPNEPILSQLLREDASFADLVTEFVAGLDQRLKKMDAALRIADFETLRVSAHQLKGAGGGFGYPVLTERADWLEQYAREHEIDACSKAVEELRSLCARVVPEPA